jgi:CheY-like chemotaxis protein
VARILIIDDETTVRRLLCEVLKDIGHSLIGVSSGKEALRLLRQDPVDLVITDILMPDMDGLEITRLVHREFPTVKIIALSGGNPDIDYCEIARFLGAHDTLTKPVSVQQLRESVAKLLPEPA